MFCKISSGFEKVLASIEETEETEETEDSGFDQEEQFNAILDELMNWDKVLSTEKKLPEISDELNNVSVTIQEEPEENDDLEFDQEQFNAILDEILNWEKVPFTEEKLPEVSNESNNVSVTIQGEPEEDDDSEFNQEEQFNAILDELMNWDKVSSTEEKLHRVSDELNNVSVIVQEESKKDDDLEFDQEQFNAILDEIINFDKVLSTEEKLPEISDESNNVSVIVQGEPEEEDNSEVNQEELDNRKAILEHIIYCLEATVETEVKTIYEKLCDEYPNGIKYFDKPIENVDSNCTDEEKLQIICCKLDEIAKNGRKKDFIRFTKKAIDGITINYLKNRIKRLKGNGDDWYTDEDLEKMDLFKKNLILFRRRYDLPVDITSKFALKFAYQRVDELRMCHKHPGPLLFAYIMLIEEYDDVLGPDIVYLASLVRADEFRNHEFHTLCGIPAVSRLD